MNYGSLAEWATVGVAAVAAVVAIIEWRKSRLVSRTTFLNELIKGFKDDELQKVFYKYIGLPDKKRQFYKSLFDFEPGSEMDIDRLLTYYNKICYMRNTGAISKKDYSLFAYQIHKVLKCQQVKDYLHDMAFKSSTANGSNYPFMQLIEEGKKVDCEASYCGIFKHLMLK